MSKTTIPIASWCSMITILHIWPTYILVRLLKRFAAYSTLGQAILGSSIPGSTRVLVATMTPSRRPFSEQTRLLRSLLAQDSCLGTSTVIKWQLGKAMTPLKFKTKSSAMLNSNKASSMVGSKPLLVLLTRLWQSKGSHQCSITSWIKSWWRITCLLSIWRRRDRKLSPTSRSDTTTRPNSKGI